MKKYKSQIRFSHLVWVVLLGLFVSACGFQLRGQHQLPVQMDRVYLDGSMSVNLQRELRHALQRAGSQVVNQVGDASAITKVHDVRYTRHVLSIGAVARVREYSGRYQLQYEVRLSSGKILQDKDWLYYQREFSYGVEQILSKEREEVRLKLDMQRQAVDTILRRLSYQSTRK